MVKFDSNFAIGVSRCVHATFGLGMILATDEFFNTYEVKASGDTRSGLKMLMQGFGCANLMGYMGLQVLLRGNNAGAKSNACFFSFLVCLVQVLNFFARDRALLQANGMSMEKMLVTILLWAFLAVINFLGWKGHSMKVPKFKLPNFADTSDASANALHYQLIIGTVFGVSMFFAAGNMLDLYKVSDLFSGNATGFAKCLIRSWGLQLLANSFVVYSTLLADHKATTDGMIRAALVFYTLTMGINSAHAVMNEHMGRSSMELKLNNLMWVFGIMLATRASTPGKKKSPSRAKAKAKAKKSTPKKKARARSKSPRRSSRKN